MSLIQSGKTFSDGEQLTAAKLNQMFADSTLSTTGVDGTSIIINQNNALAVRSVNSARIDKDAVTTDKILDGSVTKEKLAPGSIADQVYPIGSIFTTVTNYADSNAVVSAIGGTTWTAFGAGRVLIGAGTTTDAQPTPETKTFTNEEEGGEFNHTLTKAEIPNATGRFETVRATIPFANGVFTRSVNSRGAGNSTEGGDKGTTVNFDLGGGGGAHNNLQPYIVVYMWKRTA
jgi:microcystin-dependent protein